MTGPSDESLAATDGPSPEDRQGLGTVVVAFLSNLAVAIAKSVAAALTGSASMLAEAAHSWADAGNEVLLLIAERRADHARDVEHPLGYGKEAYVWSMFAAFGLFTVGAAVSITHGISELRNPEPASDFGIAYAVLAISFVLEGISFRKAFTESRRNARRWRRDHWAYVLNTSNPTLRAVFFEDAAALIGLVIAGSGIALHQLTGSAIPDALGSILVGCLLGVVAVVLMNQNRRFLVGEAAHPDVRNSVLRALLETDEIDRVTYLHLEFVGPEKIYLVAAIDLAGDPVEHELAMSLRKIEAAIEKHPVIVKAVITLATPTEPALLPE